MMEFFNSSEPVARKEHKCECCGRMIEVGEKYVRETGKFDGDFFSRAWHLDCTKVMDYFFDFLSFDDCFDYDEVIDSVTDAICYDCEKSHWKNDECEESIWHCPIIQQKIKELYSKYEGVCDK